MKLIDSFQAFVSAIIIPVCGLSGCVSEANTQNDIALALRTNPEVLLEVDDDAVSAFHSLCLSGITLPDEIRSFALLEGWQDASDEQLSDNGLSRLRKLVLVIPGGGGRFDEEQNILFHRFSKTNYIASLERQFVGSKTQLTKCDLYAKTPFLKSCESLGKLLNRAPDYNHIYKENDAQFIRWKTQIEGKAGTISCNHAPKSPTLPYDGVSLSLRVDYLSPIKKSVTSQPVLDASGR